MQIWVRGLLAALLTVSWLTPVPLWAADGGDPILWGDTDTLTFTERGSTPANPAATRWNLYMTPTGPILQDSNGTLLPLTVASSITVTPAGDIETTTVQAALEELDAKTADLDEDGTLRYAATRTGSFIFEGAGPPAAGWCPHVKATYHDTTTPGNTYICPDGEGSNPHRMEEQGDGFVEFTLDDQTVVADGPTFVTLRSRLRTHATNCTALTDGVSGQACWEQDSHRLFVCEPTAGGCDTAAEWVTPVLSIDRFRFGCTDADVGTTYLATDDFSGNCSSSESINADKVSQSFLTGVITRLRCLLGPAFASSDSTVLTARLGQVDTAVTCTVTHPAYTCESGTLAAAYTATQEITVEHAPNHAFAGGAPRVICHVDVEGVP